METKQSIFFLIQLFVFSPFLVYPMLSVSLDCHFCYCSTMFIYKIIEANCPFRLEQCLSTFYLFSNDFDALQLPV